MSARYIVAYATHPDGRLRLRDLRHVLHLADAPVPLPGGTTAPAVSDDAVVEIIVAADRSRIILDDLTGE